MKVCEEFYINGEWVKPVNDLKTLDVINPATEEVFGRIALGDKDDVDAAVEAAYKAFESFGYSSVDERVSLLEKILEVYQGKYDEIAETISSEMGAPIGLSKAAQAATGLGHFSTALETLKNYKLTIVNEGLSIDYQYDTQSKQTGITSLLQDMKEAGLKLKDLNTEQSSLEKIFVELVKEK